MFYYFIKLKRSLQKVEKDVDIVGEKNRETREGEEEKKQVAECNK